MEYKTLVIKRGKTGFGFSVTGANPAIVRRVEEGSTSYQSGLRQDDRVMRINGQNVSKSIADSVAKIVRQSDKQIVLDIERLNLESGDDLNISMSLLNISKAVRQEANSSNIHQPLNSINEVDNNKRSPSHQIVCQADIEPRPRSEASSSESFEDSSSSSFGDWSPEESSKSSFPPLRLITFDELSDPEQDRQAAINKLCQCEKDFLAQMHSGIQRYCDPLRHSLISPAEHVTLFQNVKKLVALSEYHVNKLEEDALGYCDLRDKKYIDLVGMVYMWKITETAIGFEHYCLGIKNSFRLLAELREFDEFNDFLKDTSKDEKRLTISNFIQKPLEHIKNLVLNLQIVLSLTPLEHRDMECLSQVVETLHNACNRINENNTRRCRSMSSLVNSKSSSKKRLTRSSASCSSSSSGPPSVLSSDSSCSSNIEASVDPSVLEVQRKLVFCDHVQTFQLATATRHMIYSGELLYVDGPLCTRLRVILMSDLILLAKQEPAERLLVVDHPILLKDVINTDFRDNDTLDFCLTVESALDEDWVEERDVTLRAPSMEQKYTWKNILQQRTVACKSHQDFINNDNIV